MAKKIRTIVFAVGGRGRRIASYFRSIGFSGPKPLYPAGDRPFLCRLIDMAFQLGFQRVFLLSNHYETDFLVFMKEYYPGEKRLMLVRRSRQARLNKVPPMLYSIQSRLREPFVYSDGNIFYSRQLLASLRDGPGEAQIAKIVVSRRDEARTHLLIRTRQGQLTGMDARIGRRNKAGLPGELSYFSLGLMVIRPQLFSLFPSLGRKIDLDLVLQEIFARQLKSGKKYLSVAKYRGPWLALHDKQDIDRMSKAL